MFLCKRLFWLMLFLCLSGTAWADEIRKVCSEDGECCLFTANKKARYIRYRESCPERGAVRITAVDKERVPIFTLTGFVNEGYSVPEEFVGVEVMVRADKPDTLLAVLDKDVYFDVTYAVELELKGDTAFEVPETAKIYVITPQEFLFQTRTDFPFFLEAAFDYARIFAKESKELEIVGLKDLNRPKDYFFKATFTVDKEKERVVDIDPKARIKSIRESAEYKYLSKLGLREKQQYLLKDNRLVLIKRTNGLVAETDRETFIDLDRRIRKTGWYLVNAKSLVPASAGRFRVNKVVSCKRPYCTEFRDELEVLREKYKLDAYFLPTGEK